ncbi:hypothetical protein KSF73_15450 [Burkholderiaceae bacterium DAT-1]|nr:hypothetical protein [Burkholderiaceae bacterium DAT-1]
MPRGRLDDEIRVSRFFNVPLQRPALGAGLIQDRDGFIWIGLQAGLGKWDGKQLTVFDTRNSGLSSLSVTGLLEDRKGIIWIATGGGGLNRYDKSTHQFTVYRHQQNNPASLASDHVGQDFRPHAIAEDRNGGIWVGTSEDGVCRLDQVSQNFRCWLHESGNDASLIANGVSTIAVDHHNHTWIGTESGLDRYDPVRHTFTHVVAGRINDILLAADQTIWVGTERNGLYHFDGDGHVLMHDAYEVVHPTTLGANIGIRNLAEDAQHRIWMVHSDRYLTILSPANHQYQRLISGDESNLRGRQLAALMQDRDGVMWIADYDSQLNKYDPLGSKFSLYQHNRDNPNSLPYNSVSSLYCAPDQQLWIDAFEHGLALYRPETDDFDVIPEPHAPHRPMFVDAHGQFWFGGGTGKQNHQAMFLYDPDKRIIRGEWAFPKDRPNQSAVLDPRHHDWVWIATRKAGIARFDTQLHQYTFYQHDPERPESIGSDVIWKLAFDVRDPTILWAASPGGGLIRFDVERETFTSYRHDDAHPDSIASNIVYSFVQTRKGQFWVMAKGGALELFDPNSGRFTHFSQLNGKFPDDKAVNVTEDADGDLWLNVPGGKIIRFNPDNGQFREYGAGDGVQTGAAFGAAYTHCQGRIWFGGGNGINAFDPREIRDNPRQPPVRFTAITQGGQPIIQTLAPERIKAIELDWQHNYFEFSAVALDFTHPDQNRYRFMLEGWDTGWYEAGNQPFGRYSSLRGGRYTLRVQGSNADGIFSPHEARLDVIVHPPFWLAPWFIVLTLCGSIGLLVGGVWLRITSIRRHNRALERRVAERTLELEAAMRQLAQSEKLAALGDLVAGVAHELNTPLGNIRVVSSTLGERVAEFGHALEQGAVRKSQVESFNRLCGEVSRQLEYNSSKAAHLISHFKQMAVDQASNRRRQFNLKELLEQMVVILTPRLKQTSHRIHIDISPDILMDSHPGPLEQITDNLVANALLHAFDGIEHGQITIWARKEHTFVVLKYIDNGKGIPADALHRIFEPFFTTKLGQGGSGLGLYLVFNLIATVLCGKIEAESTLGHGTTFTITLPLVAPDAPEHT